MRWELDARRNFWASKLLAMAVVMVMIFPMASAMLPSFVADHGGVAPSHDDPLVPVSSGETVDPLSAVRASGPSKVGEADNRWATFMNSERNVVRDDNGNIYVVYSSDDEIWFSRSTDSGRTFSTPVNISNNTGQAYDRTSLDPSIITNGTSLFAFWGDYTGAGGQDEWVSYRVSDDNGTTWDPPLDQQADFIPHPNQDERRMDPVAAINNTTLYVLSTSSWNNRGYQLFLSISTDSGQTWGSEMMLIDGAGGGWGNNPDEPSLAVHNDTIYIALTIGVQGGDVHYLYSTNGASSQPADFSTPQNLYAQTADSRKSSIVAHEDNVFVAWEEHLGGGVEIYFRYTTDQGTTWSPTLGNPPTSISSSSGDARFPSLTLYNSSRIFCTWWDDRTYDEGNILFSEWNSTSWTNLTNITINDNGANIPSAAEDIYNGYLDIVWINDTSAPFDVLYDSLYVDSTAPVLNWTGEQGYMHDGLDPEGNTTGHVYTYRVKYTDADNEAPHIGHPKVFIDRNLDGDYHDVNEIMTMTGVNASDTTYSDGKLYEYSTTFDLVGNYTYRFTARDSNGMLAVGDPLYQMDGPFIDAINHPPELHWLETFSYEDDGLDPENGFTNTEFYFKVRYFDALNEAPAAGFPELVLDMNGDDDFEDAEDLRLPMEEASPADTSFDNGKIYYLNRTFNVGTYGYKFYAEDAVGLLAETESRSGPTVIPLGDPPVLEVTGEAGYETDGVDPDEGTDTTDFTFKVRYSDADGHMPDTGQPVVMIDLDIDGNYTVDETFTMSEVDPLDLNVTDGKDYMFVYSFDVLANYTYAFEAMDSTGAYAEVLEFSGPNVTETNVRPQLTWMGSVGYDTDGLEPESGNANQTSFVYKVLYTDADDDPPMEGYPRIWIDMDLDGSRNVSEWFEMTDPDPNSTDYVNGKRYEYQTTLEKVGTYEYIFEAKDDNGALATGSPTREKSGPIVSPAPNYPPVLSLLNTGDYNGTGVHPKKGDLDTEFVYKVEYIDAEGDLPGEDWPRLYIDILGDGDFNDPDDVVAVMEEEDANDLDVTDGKVYMYETLLPMESDDYQYKFKAEDVNSVEATGPGTVNDQVFFGPVVYVNKNPILSFQGATGFENDGVDPDAAIEGSTFTFRVVYSDTEADIPMDDQVVLRIDMDMNGAIDETDPAVEMEAVGTDLNYTIGVEYMVEYTFDDPGEYGYRFEARDIVGNPANGPATVQYIPGPMVEEEVPNMAPVLRFTGELHYENDGLNPLRGEEGMTFSFRIKYIDPDNDAPKANYPVLAIGEMTEVMEACDPSDDNFMDGKLYRATVTLKKSDTYTYSFEVENEMNQTATLGPMDGPVVVSTEDTGDDDTTDQMMSNYLWLLILVIVVVLTLLIGYRLGTGGEPEEPPRPPRETGAVPTAEPVPATGPISLTEGEVDEPGGEAAPVEETPDSDMAEEASEEGVGEAPEPEEGVGAEPGSPEEGMAGGAATSLETGAEQPAESGDEAQAPEDTSTQEGETEAERRGDLKAKQDETEVPAEDTETEEGVEDNEEVDDEIDDILSKLEEED